MKCNTIIEKKQTEPQWKNAIACIFPESKSKRNRTRGEKKIVSFVCGRVP